MQVFPQIEYCVLFYGYMQYYNFKISASLSFDWVI